MTKPESRIAEIIARALDRRALTTGEIEAMLDPPPYSPESYALMSAANRLTREAAGHEAMISGQIGLNAESCSKNCDFCAFATVNGLVEEESVLSKDELEREVRSFIEQGVNYISLMTTADYPFEKFLEMSAAARRLMPDGMMLSANIGDFSREEARALGKAGYGRVYHVLRLGEGIHTEIDPQERERTIRAAAEENLEIAFCIEPIGPEHGPVELARQIELSLEFHPTMMAVMRRVPLRGTVFEDMGLVPEIRIAQIMAAVRLAYAHHEATKTFYIHEPSLPGLMAGANLVCAESAANPREVRSDERAHRGFTVEKCRSYLFEAGFALRKEPNYPGSWFRRYEA